MPVMRAAGIKLPACTMLGDAGAVSRSTLTEGVKVGLEASIDGDVDL